MPAVVAGGASSLDDTQWKTHAPGRWRERVLDCNPHDADHDIHSLCLTSRPLETPHPILLVIPVCATRGVHASSPHRLGGRRFAASIGLRGGGGVGEVLDDGAVDCKLVFALLVGRGGGGLGDEGFQDAVDDGVVPSLRLAVVVEGDGGEGGLAGVLADLFQASIGHGLWREGLVQYSILWEIGFVRTRTEFVAMMWRVRVC